MAALNTDLFKKLPRKWVGSVGSGGVADDAVTTVPLASSTNLPTDTSVVAVIDRVDVNGTATADLEESVIGVVSGSNLVTCTRGAEGTAQAHSAGAVVEILFTNQGWGDLVDGILVQHNQLGLHTNITACNVTASGIVSGVVADWDGWMPAGETWTYAAADDPTFTITVPSGAAAKYSIGMKIKLTNATVKYFIITKVADTVLTVYGGTDYNLVDAAITSPYYSTMKAPLGFPLDPDKWTVETTDTGNQNQSTPAEDVWYNLGSISIDIPIGCWRVNYQVNFIFNKTTATSVQGKTTLSTANNSESDAEMTCHARLGATEATLVAGHTFNREKNMTLSTKDTFYLNASAVDASTNNIYFRGDTTPTIIRAICAYL